jgi:heterodisulfide reductase subunit B
MGFLSMVMVPARYAVAQDAAQEDAAAKQDKIKALELLYISRELDLTSQEAEKFWPVYKKYSKEVNELLAERKRKAKELKGQPRTDAIAEEALDKELGYERRMLEIKTRYKQEFMKILPARKVGNIYRSEREFRAMMIRQLKERKDNRMLRKRQ